MAKWLDDEDVLQIAEDQIERFGGTFLLLKPDGLASATARPQQLSAYGEVSDLVALGAAYAFGISANHPFLDGNKRTAFMAMFTFLLDNGLLLTAVEGEPYRLMVDLADGKISEPELVAWVRAHVVRVRLQHPD